MSVSRICIFKNVWEDVISLGKHLTRLGYAQDKRPKLHGFHRFNCLFWGLQRGMENDDPPFCVEWKLQLRPKPKKLWKNGMLHFGTQTRRWRGGCITWIWLVRLVRLSYERKMAMFPTTIALATEQLGWGLSTCQLKHQVWVPTPPRSCHRRDR